MQPAVDFVHVPVLMEQVLAGFDGLPDGLLVDCTAGGAGHSKALLSAFPRRRLLALDRDLDAVVTARSRLSTEDNRVEVVHATFAELPDVLKARQIEAVAGILADIGVSSHHLDTPARGFSFGREGPLDMRMDASCGATLQEKLAAVSERELADILYQYGDVRGSRRTAAAVIQAWRDGCQTTTDLAQRLKSSLPWGGKTHPATRVFQALRIWVNDELGQLETLLDNAPRLLTLGGVMAVISFHSGEDRIVKRRFRSLARGKDASFELLSKKPMTATAEEVATNPRARSAKLRAIRRRE